jgi:Outer membrane protein beta-barrel domain
MKKILLFLFVVASTTVQAQEFKKFKMGIGLAPIAFVDTYSAFGAQIYFEPTFRITDNIAISYKVDISGRFKQNEGFQTDNTVVPYISNTFNTQFYFSKGTFRPFFGLGIGLFTQTGYVLFSKSGSSAVIPAGSLFGVCPRFGFDISHFNFSIDANILPATKNPNIFNTTISNIGNTYV